MTLGNMLDDTTGRLKKAYNFINKNQRAFEDIYDRLYVNVKAKYDDVCKDEYGIIIKLEDESSVDMEMINIGNMLIDLFDNTKGLKDKDESSDKYIDMVYNLSVVGKKSIRISIK